MDIELNKIVSLNCHQYLKMTWHWNILLVNSNDLSDIDEVSKILSVNHTVEILHFESYRHIRTFQINNHAIEGERYLFTLTFGDRSPRQSIRIEHEKHSPLLYISYPLHSLILLWV